MQRILILDDDEAIRRSLCKALRMRDYAVAEASDVPSALDELRSEHCDLVLLDLCLPGILGIDGIGMIHGVEPTIPVIVVTGTATVEDAVECMKGGACDLIVKPVRVKRLFEAVAAALNRKSTSTGGAPSSRRSEMTERIRRAVGAWGLTRRESQVLASVIAGCSNKDIAVAMSCSVRAVELHVSGLLQKSKTESRTALAAEFWLGETW